MAQKSQKTFEFDTIVIGAGPSGLAELKNLLLQQALKVHLLEAEDRIMGRLAHGPLHLMTDVQKKNTRRLQPAKLRWEREWVDPAKFEFDDKEWALIVPQWKHYFGRELCSVDENTFSVSEELNSYMTLSIPVSQIEKTDENTWTLTGPKSVYKCRSVVWCAGLESFQNAFGKEAAREYLVPNPNYDADAREVMGGMALNWIFSSNELPLVDNLPTDHVICLPVKHNKLYYLCILTIEASAENTVIKSLCYLPAEILKYPKELLSFQKSLRRVLKTLFQEGAEVSPREVMIQTPKLCGHSLGMPWILTSQESSLSFKGDETLTSVSDKNVVGLESLLLNSLLHEINEPNQDVVILTDTENHTYG